MSGRAGFPAYHSEESDMAEEQECTHRRGLLVNGHAA